jgi:hypothetical protein
MFIPLSKGSLDISLKDTFALLFFTKKLYIFSILALLNCAKPIGESFLACSLCSRKISFVMFDFSP